LLIPILLKIEVVVLTFGRAWLELAAPPLLRARSRKERWCLDKQASKEAWVREGDLRASRRQAAGADLGEGDLRGAQQ
jgi:membrane protein required for beta-lactamase induction